MKIEHFFWLLGLLPLALSAQHSLHSTLNMYRPGDVIIKQQVNYKSPGRSGENALWDFSKLTPVNKEYKLTYSLRQDSLLKGTEHQTAYYYQLRNDSLLSWGYENATTLMTHNQPELLLKFPVSYGNKTKNYYHGHGAYCGQLELDAMGIVESEADAYGMMVLPNKDTLRNVLRVRTVKYIADDTKLMSYKQHPVTVIPADSIDYRLASDSLFFVVETYRWYEKGYRYPVFETVRSWVQRPDTAENFLNTAFFYPPQQHYYLNEDEENLAVLESMEENSESIPEGNRGEDNGGGNHGKTGDTNSSLPLFTYYDFYPNPVGDVLTIEYYALGGEPVDFILCNLQGVQIESVTSTPAVTGIHVREIRMDGYARGNYILKIRNGEEVKSEIIIKK